MGIFSDVNISSFKFNFKKEINLKTKKRIKLCISSRVILCFSFPQRYIFSGVFFARILFIVRKLSKVKIEFYYHYTCIFVFVVCLVVSCWISSFFFSLSLFCVYVSCTETNNLPVDNNSNFQRSKIWFTASLFCLLFFLV